MVSHEKDNAVREQVLVFEKFQQLAHLPVQQRSRFEIVRVLVPHHGMVRPIRRQGKRRRIDSRHFLACLDEGWPLVCGGEIYLQIERLSGGPAFQPF